MCVLLSERGIVLLALPGMVIQRTSSCSQLHTIIEKFHCNKQYDQLCIGNNGRLGAKNYISVAID